MKPLTERMTKGGAAKSWIKEVEAKDREIESLEQTKDQYLNIIDLLAREKEELEAENKKVVNAAESGIAKAWKRVEELEAEIEKRMLYGAELAQERNDLRKENTALSELLSPLVDVELERDKLKDENKRLRELPERIKRMCHIKEAWQADGALCDIEDYIDSLLEGSE